MLDFWVALLGVWRSRYTAVAFLFLLFFTLEAVVPRLQYFLSVFKTVAYIIHLFNVYIYYWSLLSIPADSPKYVYKSYYEQMIRSYCRRWFSLNGSHASHLWVLIIYQCHLVNERLSWSLGTSPFFIMTPSDYICRSVTRWLCVIDLWMLWRRSVCLSSMIPNLFLLRFRNSTSWIPTSRWSSFLGTRGNTSTRWSASSTSGRRFSSTCRSWLTFHMPGNWLTGERNVWELTDRWEKCLGTDWQMREMPGNWLTCEKNAWELTNMPIKDNNNFVPRILYNELLT